VLWTIRRTRQAGSGKACDPTAAPVLARRSEMREQGCVKSKFENIGIPVSGVGRRGSPVQA